MMNQCRILWLVVSLVLVCVPHLGHAQALPAGKLGAFAIPKMSQAPKIDGTIDPVEWRDAWPADTRGVIPRLAKPPTIDGVIDPAEWAGACEMDAQVSQGAAHAFLPRSVTWYLGWDATNLYLACRSPLAPNERVKRVARQPVGSTVMMDDSIELWLDPRGRNEGEHLASYVQAMVNALGITYYKQTFPKIGAINNAWKPDWRIACKLAPDFSAVTWELAMPASSFDLPQPNRAGDPWGLMLARNFMYQAWDQSAMAWRFPGFGFSVNSDYPVFTLADGAPVVKFHSPLPIMRGRAYADVDILNPAAVPVTLSVTFGITAADGKSVFEKQVAVTVPAGGTAPFRIDEPASPAIDPAVSAAYRYALTVTTPDGTREIFHTHFAFNPTKARYLLDRTLPPPPELIAQATLNPVRGLVETKVDVIDFPRRDEVAAARLVVTDAGGKVLADQKTALRFADMFTFWAPLPSLAAGKYPWTASVILKDGTEFKAGTGEIEKKNEAAAFPWWNSKLGDANKVLWPFTAVAQEKQGKILRAWGKEYQLDGLALPRQIRVTGNADKWPAGRSGQPELLAAPITCEAVIGGKILPVVARRGGPNVLEAKEHQIALAGAGAAGPLAVRTTTRLEQDGAYFVELTLAPAKTGQPVTVDRFDLRIPVRMEVAEYLNTFGVTGHGGGYVMKQLPAQPAGTAAASAKAWDSRENGSGVMTVGSFIPQVWLGSEFRGLLWYADNDRGWTPANDRVAQDVVREGGRATMRFHFIDTPTVIDAPRTVCFVLQPTPIRPLTPGWRMLNVNFTQSFLNWDAMGRSRAAYSATVNLANDAAYAKSAAYAANCPGPKAPQPNLASYFAPHTESSGIMTTDWPARNYFGGEWEGGTYTDTLIDHTLWWVNKWIEQGGLQGLYHDQFAPHTIASVSSGLAYVLPDGRVQPGYALTTRRRYVMRQHALWLEKGIARPRTLTHTTNGGPMGSFGWIESCIDGEAKLINKGMGLDFADTWPSERLRTGSFSYNLGATYGWMRLIDETGMTDAEKEHHRRVYAGHCLMHDTVNAWVWSYAPRNAPDSPLIKWGMNDDRVFFWPFWRNNDVVSVTAPDVKVSVWTLPAGGEPGRTDRVLLCVFNYGKDPAADCTVTLNLKKLGVTLPADAKITDLEKKATALAGDAAKGTVTLTIPKRDYVLVSLAGVNP